MGDHGEGMALRQRLWKRTGANRSQQGYTNATGPNPYMPEVSTSSTAADSAYAQARRQNADSASAQARVQHHVKK